MPSLSASSIAKRIIPLLDRVLICRAKPLEKTASGLLLPKAAQETLNEGHVVAVGPGTEEHQMALKVGDRVILPSFGGMTVKLEDEKLPQTPEKDTRYEYLLYKESEILAKVHAE